MRKFKRIKCGRCGVTFSARISGNSGYGICKCGIEYRVKLDKFYPMIVRAAALPLKK